MTKARFVVILDLLALLALALAIGVIIAKPAQSVPKGIEQGK